MLRSFFSLYLLIIILSFAGAQDNLPESRAADSIPLELLDSFEGRRTVFEAVVNIFQENYWDANYTDWQAWAENYRARALAAEGRFAFEQIMFTMVNALQDDHSRWLGKGSSTELIFEPRDNSELPLLMGFNYQNIPDYGLVILRIYADSPAQKAGLRRGDVITAIDGISLLQKDSATVQEIIRPRQETRLLSVQRQHELLELPIQATALDMDYLEPLPTGYMLEPTIGYLHLPSFYHPQIAEYSHTIVHRLQAQGAQKLIIDMRNNTGGELGQLGLVLGIFLDAEHMPWSSSFSRGELSWQAYYQAEDNSARHWLETPEGKTISYSNLTSQPAHFTGDIVLIINHSNSSAGEIMPLALQHHRQTYIIGTNTSGNTETIQVFNLPDGSVVLVAVSQLYLAGQAAAGIKVDKVSLETARGVARGFDAPVAEALKFLKNTDFVPGRYF